MRSLWAAAVRTLPASILARFAPDGIVAPCYHLVSDQFPAHTRRLYDAKNIREFESDLDWMLRWFRPISLGELHDAVARGGPLPSNRLFLSFDDGLRECRDVVADLCRAKGIPASFFLNTAFLDNQALCYRHKVSVLIESSSALDDERLRARLGNWPCDSPIASQAELQAFLLAVPYGRRFLLDECARLLDVDFGEYLRTHRPYLSTSDVVSLARQGFAIGGHSVDHPRYSELDLDEQLAQTDQCLRELGRSLDLTVKAFAFPFVSDGVAEPFFREVFSRNIADLVFYTGSPQRGGDRRVLWRLGVESRGMRPFSELLGNEIARQTWARLARLRPRPGLRGGWT